MEDNNLERERLEFEKQKLEFEKQKFEHEKKNKEHYDGPSKFTLNAIIIYIASAVLFISIFLPWLGSRGSVGSFSLSMSANALATGFAFYIIPLALAASALVFFKKIKFASIPGGLALLVAFSAMFGIGSVSYSGYGASVSAGISFGPLVSALSSLVIIIASLMKEVQIGESINLKEVIVKYKKQLFFAYLIFSLLVYYAGYNLLGHIPLKNIFMLDVLAIICFTGIPLWGAHKLGYKNLKVLYISFLVFMVLNFIGDIYLYYAVGLGFINAFYVYFFIPFLIIAILSDLEIQYAYKEKVNSLLKKFTPKTTLIVLLSPILFFVIYHLLINRSVPKDDENPFWANHQILEGNWYFTDKDSSAVYFLDVKFSGSNLSSGSYFYLRDNHSLTDFFKPITTNKMSGTYNFTAHKWDSLMIPYINISLEPKKYNEPLVLPIKNEELEIDFKDGRLIVSFLKHNINSRTAYKDLNSPQTQNLITLIKGVKARKEQAHLLPSEFLGTWSHDANLEEFSCEYGFYISQRNNEIFLSSGTEWGGYNGKSKKVKEYYQVDFEQRSEGESWNAKILLKMAGENLYVSFSGQANDFQKMYRCSNSN